MDNGILVAPRGPLARRNGARAALVVVGMALVVAAVIALQRPASAQIGFGGNITSLVCGILNSLIAAFSGFFGGFLRPILSAIAAAFGCGTISG